MLTVKIFFLARMGDFVSTLSVCIIIVLFTVELQSWVIYNKVYVGDSDSFSSHTFCTGSCS